jgi:hypothetical protein
MEEAAQDQQRRVPQIDDDVHIEIRLSPSTEEWAEELLERADIGFSTERTDDALIVKSVTAGNCSGLDNLASALSEMSEALREGEIDPMEFSVSVRSMEKDTEPNANAATEQWQ